MSSDVTFQNYIRQSPHMSRAQGKKERKSNQKNSSRFHHLSLQRLSAPSVVPAHINCSRIRAQSRAPPWLHSPQNVVDPDDVAFVGGFVVNGDGGSGLDPQVAPPPLEPAVIAGHHLTFPQHWGEDADTETEGERTDEWVVGWAPHQQRALMTDREELSEQTWGKQWLWLTILMALPEVLQVFHVDKVVAGVSDHLCRGQVHVLWDSADTRQHEETRSRGSRPKELTQFFEKGLIFCSSVNANANANLTLTCQSWTLKIEDKRWTFSCFWNQPFVMSQERALFFHISFFFPLTTEVGCV